jgi:hypothetical protein
MGMAWGRGWGRGRGRGGGWGRGRDTGFYPYPHYSSEAVPPYPVSPVSPATLDPKEESKYLEQTLTSLKAEIKQIEKRLEELTSEEEE